MAGETVKSEAICLQIHPWSQTSHVVSWLTPAGKVTTVVKGAERPKSYLLGQYDLNYTCEILFYARGRGDVHALREASPLKLREGLRESYRALALAGYWRQLVGELAPAGAECAAWYRLLEGELDRLEARVREDADQTGAGFVQTLVVFELEVLKLAGLQPDFSGYDRTAGWSAFGVEIGAFGAAAGGRQIRISREVAEFLENPRVAPKNPEIPLDAARVISVFYQFHLDCASDVRRTVLKLIS